jgi:hypothetical protein
VRALKADADKLCAGRPRKNPPADAAQRIQAAASQGASLIGIANACGVGRDVLSRWFEETPALRDALDMGREEERKQLHNVLFELATKEKDKIAAMFLLKARHGYREGDQEQQANRVSITFTLPGAMKPDQFTVENEPST